MKFAFGFAMVAAVASGVKVQGDEDTLQFNVQTTEPGQKGKGCKENDEATVNYTGKFQDGKVFDSSVGKEPLKFNLGQGQVIKCWDAAFTQMSVGEKATLTCPPNVAYGEKGAGDDIPPNTTLFFDVEVIKCEPASNDY